MTAVSDNILVHSMEILLAASSHHDRPQTNDRQQDTDTRDSHTTSSPNTPQTATSLDDVAQGTCSITESEQPIDESEQHVTMTDLPSVTSGGDFGTTITTMQLSADSARGCTTSKSSIPLASEHVISGVSHTIFNSSSHIATNAELESRIHLAAREMSLSACRIIQGRETIMKSISQPKPPMKTHNSSRPEIKREQLTLMETFTQDDIDGGLSGSVGKQSRNRTVESNLEENSGSCRTVECQTMSWEEIVAMVSMSHDSNRSKATSPPTNSEIQINNSEKIYHGKQNQGNTLSYADIDTNSASHNTANVCTNSEHYNSYIRSHTENTSKSNEVTQYFCKYCNNHFHLCQHVYTFIEKGREVSQQKSRKGKKKKAKKHDTIEDWFVTICNMKKKITGRFTCKICDKSFTKSSHLKSHHTTHTGAKPFKCKHCSKSYTQKSSLNIHARVHTGEVWYRCDQCRKYFRTQESLEKHLVGHMEKKPFDCPQCKADFKTIEALERHLVKHGEDEQTRLCEHCGKHFANKKTLRQHIKFMHTIVGLSEKEGTKEELPGLKCDLCSKMFRSKYHLISHRITHTNSRPFPCDECEKTYRTPSALRGHKKAVHAGIKDHICDVCHMGFPTPAQLRNHQTRHTGERPHKCTYCKAAFRHANSLRFHIRKHTGEKPHVCPHCERSFRFPGNLKAHIMTHTKERPWQCDSCGKSFARQATLVDHKKSHTGEKNCICMYCGKAYRLRGHLRYHMKSHTKSKLDQEFDTSISMAIPVKLHVDQNLPISSMDQAKKLDPHYGASETVAVPLRLDENYAIVPPPVQSMSVPVALHSVPQPPLPYTYQ